jgi:hypothetical protein
MFQPEKSDFQSGTRQWKFANFQKGKNKKPSCQISVVGGSKRVAQNISCIFCFFFFFSFIFYSQIWLNLLMDAYL